MGLKTGDSRKKDRLLVERKSLERESKLQLPAELLDQNDTVVLQLSEEGLLEANARYVPVGTKPITPDGCNSKEQSKAKRHLVRFRCSAYEKKLLRLQAERSRLSMSEFCRRAVFQVEIKERLSDEQIEIYKTLVKYHNNFKSIGNMFRKRDSKLTQVVYQLAKEIKEHLQLIHK